jgi:N-hydroxyarylamine O-acetyltransferase
MLDLDAYLERIGLNGRPSVVEMHRAHVTAIPFENLDPLGGMPVSLAPEALTAKLIDARRGGYCFEHNLLFRQVLERLGAQVEPLLARVRGGGSSSPAGPLTHLLLRVEHNGALWHMDVGFGQGTLLEPIPFGPGGPYEQSGWRFRVISEGSLLVLQTEIEESWSDLYAFSVEPVPEIDIEVSNWFTSTHPQSRFVTHMLVTAHDERAVRSTLSDFAGELTLSVSSPTLRTREPVAEADVPRVLADVFGLTTWRCASPRRTHGER